MTTNTVKHTPGPWRAIKAAHGPIDIFDSRDRDIVTIFGGGVGAESKEANACLIAAAPDLLEVAQRILDRGYVSESIEEERDDHLALVAAISKATGSPAPQEKGRG